MLERIIMKRQLLSIVIGVHENMTPIYEDLMAYPLDNGLAIAKSRVKHRWIIFDIKSGLSVFSRYNKSKEKTLEEFNQWLDEEKLARLEKNRHTLSYNGRCLEMERHSMYR